MTETALKAVDSYFGGADSYISPVREISFFNKHFPSTMFYMRGILGPVQQLCIAAKLGKCDDYAWAHASARVGRLLEQLGCRIEIQGLEHLRTLEEPCVIVANHMSTLETFLLPSILRPSGPVTFVVKESLMRAPWFGDVLASRDVISVGRNNPREDLKLMLDEGKKRLDKGMSVVIFPQSTRGIFELAKFNSIGVKLAKHAGKPILPLALKTDAWAQGKIIKDFGLIVPKRTIYFHMGAPMHVQGNGKAEHANICQFISQCLTKWGEE